MTGSLSSSPSSPESPLSDESTSSSSTTEDNDSSRSSRYVSDSGLDSENLKNSIDESQHHSSDSDLKHVTHEVHLPSVLVEKDLKHKLIEGSFHDDAADISLTDVALIPVSYPMKTAERFFPISFGNKEAVLEKNRVEKLEHELKKQEKKVDDSLLTLNGLKKIGNDVFNQQRLSSTVDNELNNKFNHQTKTLAYSTMKERTPDSRHVLSLLNKLDVISDESDNKAKPSRDSFSSDTANTPSVQK